MVEASRDLTPSGTSTAGEGDPLIGRMIHDRFRILELIDRGGMAKVYRAEQASLGRHVALKILDPTYTGHQNPEFEKRFVLEASASAKLTHPNTVTIFDYGSTDDGIYFIAMELLYGRTLAAALRAEAPFTLERTVHIAWQMCRSLREAHGLGVIHRDLKPGNIFLVQHDEDPDFVKVLDFGLVKYFNAPAQDLTEAGLLIGSPRYMSPEQARGEAADPRSDIYAVGVILYEMLAGRPPFHSASNVDVLVAQLERPPPSFFEANPTITVPLEVEEIVLRCLAKRAAERYDSMDELLQALRGLFGGDPLSGGEGSQTNRIPTVALAAAGAAAIPRAGGAAVRLGSSRRRVLLIVGALALAASVAVGLSQTLFRTEPPTIRATGTTPDGAAASHDVAGTRTRPPPPLDGRTPSPQREPPAPAASVALEQPRLPIRLRSTPAGAVVFVGDAVVCPATPCDVQLAGSHAETGRPVRFRFKLAGQGEIVEERVLGTTALTVSAGFARARPPRAAARIRPKRGEAAPAAESKEKSSDDYKENPY